MALVSAQQNGDPYPIGETLVVDGITTIMAALLGSWIPRIRIASRDKVKRTLGGVK